jgi:hypothetical protein
MAAHHDRQASDDEETWSMGDCQTMSLPEMPREAG